MNRTTSRPSRPSLLTRISETRAQASSTVDRAYRESPRQQSFVERYRGTEFESPAPVMIRDDHTSRGRSYVIVGGTAALSIVGMLLVAAAS